MKNKIKKRKKQCKKSNNKLKKIISIIEYIIVSFIILVNIMIMYKAIHNPNKTPDIFGKKAFVIVSGSMIPQIKIGDIVIINDTKDVKINDIIAFRRDSNVIVHRIVNEMKVNGKVMYQTKGDNNNICDAELVDISDIEGIYAGKVPYIGNILIMLYNNLAIVVVIVVVILIIRYYFFGSDDNNNDDNNNNDATNTNDNINDYNNKQCK